MFTPLAFSLLMMLGSPTIDSSVATTRQATPAPAVTASQAEVLAVLAFHLATSGNIESSQSVFDRAIQVAEVISDRAAKIRALSAIAFHLAQVSQTARSEQLFNKAVQLTKQTNSEFNLYAQGPALRDVIIQMAQAGQTERALQLTKTLSSNFHKAQALNEIAASLANRGQWQQAKPILLQALQFARGMTGDYAYESNGFCGNDKFAVLSQIAGNLSLLSELDRALQVAGSVSGCSSAAGQSTQDYQAWAFLGILNHLTKVEPVKRTWTSAQAIRSPLEQSMAWSAIAVKLIDLGEVPLALSIAQKITAIPPVKDYSPEWTLLNFGAKENALRDIALKLSQKQQFEAAMKVVQGMSASPPVSGSMPESDLFPQPSIKDTTLGEMAHQLALAGQVSQALQIAKSIPNTEAKALAQIAIARVLQTTKQESQASKLLQDLALPPTPTTLNDYSASQPISHIATALVTVGQTERALQMAASLPSDLMRETTLTDMAVQLADLGQIESALKLANRLKGEGSRSILSQKVASKLVAVGQLERAFQIASSIPGSPSSLEGSEKAKLFAEIASKFAQLGKRSQALKAAETIEDDELKAKTIAEIATKLAL
ncbi:MAG TPA: hypothetical protein V6D26_03190 [Stenomitos sp.]